MNGKTGQQGESKITWPWLAAATGFLILLASLVHVSSAWDALNHFDPPKRQLWALLALVLAGTWSVRKIRFERAPLLLSLGLLAWMVVRTLLKPRPDVEQEVLFAWILPLLLFILAISLDDKRRVRIIGSFLVLACLIQAGLMVLQRLGFDPLFFDTTLAMDYKPGRMVGTIGYHNQAVDFLALSSVGILLVSQSLWLRVAFMSGMLLVAGLTGNRGGVLALTLALLVSMVFSVGLIDTWSRRKKWITDATVILGLCGVWFVMAMVPETGSRFREVATDFNHSPAVESRVVMARVGMAMLREKPWVGWGAGEYAFQYLDRLGDVLPREKTHAVLGRIVFAREAHNDPLQFAVEFGLVGVLFVAALLGIAVARVVLSRRVCGASGLGVAFILTYMAVSSLFSFPWQTSMGGPMAGLLLGWLWPRGNRLGFGSAEPGRGAKPWALITQSVLLVLSLFLVMWFAEDAFLNTAVPKTLAAEGPAATERLLPSYAYRYYALVGAAYASQSDYGEAEKVLIHADQGYCDIPLWNNLGHVQGKMGKWDEAQKVYVRWARCGLDYADALMDLSIAYEQTGKVKDAAEMLAKRNALWRNTSLEEVKRLAVLQLQSGNPQAAGATLLRYRQKWEVADSKTVAEFENIGGGIYLALGDKQEAAKWFRSALDKDPALESARRNLGRLAGPPGGQNPFSVQKE